MSNATMSTAVRARRHVVLRALSQQGFVLLAVVVPPLVAALAYAEWMFALSLLPQTSVLCAIAVRYRTSDFPQDLRRVEAFVVFSLLFIIASLLVVPPFMLLGMPPLDALFEAVSGITSTGLSVASGTPDWPVPAHLLRGWLQWCGGFAIAFAGLAIFAGSSGASQAISSSTIADRDNLASVKVQARQILKAYMALTVIAVLLCVALLPNWWEGVSVALAAVSTGGFAPRPDSLESYSPLAQAVVLGICVATAISLLFYVQAWRDGLRAALGKTHVAATLSLMAAMVLLYCGIDFVVNRPPAMALYANALNLLSGFTTAGFSVSTVSAEIALLPVLLLVMLIGGDVGSTGGGLKVSRVIILARMVRLNVQRVRVPPRAVTYLTDRGKKVEVDQVIGVTALLVTYLVTMLLCWTVFLVSGIAPMAGLFEVVSALSTVGLSQGVTAPDLAPHLKLTLIIAMMLGRLEFVALIILCLPGTWIKRS